MRCSIEQQSVIMIMMERDMSLAYSHGSCFVAARVGMRYQMNGQHRKACIVYEAG